MATDRSPVVEARGLSKRFGDVEALVGLDVEAQSGGVTALLGPDGAGKTTFVSAVASLVSRPRLLPLDEPTSGLDPRSRHDLLEAAKDRAGGSVIEVRPSAAGDIPTVEDILASVGSTRGSASEEEARCACS